MCHATVLCDSRVRSTNPAWLMPGDSRMISTIRRVGACSRAANMRFSASVNLRRFGK